jgi:hypothetical protein
MSQTSDPNAPSLQLIDGPEFLSHLANVMHDVVVPSESVSIRLKNSDQQIVIVVHRSLAVKQVAVAGHLKLH